MPDPTSNLMPSILERVASDFSSKKGDDQITVWTNTDFLDLAGRWAIDKALQKLVNGGKMVRPRRGFYHIALEPNPLTGRSRFPSRRSYAEAVIRRDRLNAVPSPDMAANEIGLELQVPAQAIYYSDGAPRRIPIPNPVAPDQDIYIEFKRLSPRLAFWAGHPAMRFVQALDVYGDQFTMPDQRPEGERTLRRMADKLASGGVDEAEAVLNDLRNNITALKGWRIPAVRQLISLTESLLVANPDQIDENESRGPRP